MTTPSVPAIPELAERLRKLEAKATPGPWEIGYGIEATIQSTDGCVAIMQDGTTVPVDLDAPDDPGSMEANAALIVALHNALPEIIEKLERLEKLEAANV